MSLGHGSGLFTHTEDNLSTSGTDILCLVGGRIAGATYTKSIVAADGGHICNLRVELKTAPGAGKSRTFTLWKDGSSTALTCTISGTDTTGSDMVNSITLSAGAYYEWRCTSASTPAASPVRISARFNPFAAGDHYTYNFSGTVGVTKLSASNLEDISLAGDISAPVSGTAGSRAYVLSDGDVDDFSVRLDTATPSKSTPTASRQFQLFKNGLAIGAGITITFDETDASGTIKTVSVATGYQDGDYFTVQSTITVGAPQPSYVSVAIALSADVDEFVVPLTSMENNLPTGTVTHQAHIAKGEANIALFSSTQERFMCGMAWRGKKFLTYVSQLPGGKGQSWAIGSPYGFQTIYGPASAAVQTDTTGGVIQGVFDDNVHLITATSIDGAIKSKHSFALLLEPTPQMRGGMGGHF